MKINARLPFILGLTGWLLFPPAVAASAPELSNRLKAHPSPYLAMHADDPVAWQDWGEEALDLARRQNKLLYLSSGYFACHWCHVMQRESYRDPDIARFINEHFIPVKLDRELEPALDSTLLAFARRTRGIGGWPLNVFLTPEGYPLYALLYVPPQEFMEALARLQALWAQDRDRLSRLARQEAPPAPRPAFRTPRRLSAAEGREAAQRLTAVALAQADPFYGGFGQQSKFPSVPLLQSLLTRLSVWPDPALQDFLVLTLDKMAQLGLYDHLGGGFFRYTIDPFWAQPHFEKMLYDNVLLARLYLRAARQLGREDYEQVARRTLDFVAREMRKDGGFIASLSAVDDKGVEGGYYLWNPKQLQVLLTPGEREAYRLAYGMTGTPAFEAGYLPLRSMSPPQLARQLGRDRTEVEALLARAEGKLLEARQRRGLPRDTKRLAGWNGLALAAFAEAALLTGEQRYREAARGVRDYLVQRLWDGRSLRRAVAEDGRPMGAVSIEDYAFVAEGLYEWARLTGSQQDYRQAAAVAKVAWERFYTARGWWMNERRRLPIEREQGALPDGPLPSPSAVLIATSLALAPQTQDRRLEKKASEALALGLKALREDPLGYASYLGVSIRSGIGGPGVPGLPRS